MTLHFGSDDLGSVMLEENVVRAAGTVVTASVERLSHLIQTAGFRPAQRDTQYRIIGVPPA
jgi:cyclic dehypoxanthinyl futalosine synthase